MIRNRLEIPLLAAAAVSMFSLGCGDAAPAGKQASAPAAAPGTPVAISDKPSEAASTAPTEPTPSEPGTTDPAPARTAAEPAVTETQPVSTAANTTESKPEAKAEAKSDDQLAAAPADKKAADKKADKAVDSKNPAKAKGDKPFDPTADVMASIASRKIGKGDWPQWGGGLSRNNTPDVKSLPTEWDIEKGENVKWAVRLGSQTYGNPTVAKGKVYVGTNNGAGYVKRFPASVDLGCLICFDEKTGEFLWQHSNTKLPTGRVHDWPLMGVCSSGFTEGDKYWYVSNRGEVVCLDPEGFRDGVNNGPYKGEENENKDEADVIWRYDMMGELGTSQHNMCSCSVTAVGDVLFVCTGNGVDESHLNIPAPNAPSFLALDKNTGKLLWADKSPGENIIHGQWSSPAYGTFDGQDQIIFAGGDSWLYSFDPKGDGNGKAKLLWKFDANPKESRSILGGRGTRNEIIGTPVIYDGLIYIAVGQDPEHGEGIGHFWCIDPTKRGDVSPSQVFDKGTKKIIPHRRLQAFIEWEQVFSANKKAADGLADGKVSDELRAEFKKAGKPLPEAVTVKLNEKEGEAPKSKKKIQDWVLSGKDGDKEVLFRVDIEAGSLKGYERTNEVEEPNKNSAVVWHYSEYDLDGNGSVEFEETMHRTIGTAAIKDDLVFIADFSGLVHCLDARTGKPHWTHDMFAASWGSPLIADGKVYIGDEDGDITIFKLSAEKDIVAEISMKSAVYSTPIVANGVLYLANKSALFAIQEGAKSKPLAPAPEGGATDE